MEKGSGIPIRKPAVSSLFYPSSADELRAEVNRYIDEAKLKERKKPWGLIAPHAGYKYSGTTAGYAYASVKNKQYDTVVIFAPSHYAFFKEAGLIKANYYNSLGTIQTNVRLIDELVKESDLFKYIPEAHYHEHSIEVHLPFLQTALKGDFNLIPIILSNSNYERIDQITDLLLQKLNLDKTLFIASSDLSHYHDYDEANKLDRIAVNTILKVKADLFYKAGIDRKFEACGFLPITALLMISQKTDRTSAKELYYNNSGDIIPDKSRVVGYTAIAFFNK